MASSRTDSRGRAFKKSQLQIQIYVNRRREELEKAIRTVLPGLDQATQRFRWVSPLESDKFREYRDRSFLVAIERSDLADELKKFWPRGGAHWDALAILEFHGGGSGCAYRAMPITDSGASRSLIPAEADHRFRSKPIAERMTW